VGFRFGIRRRAGVVAGFCAGAAASYSLPGLFLPMGCTHGCHPGSPLYLPAAAVLCVSAGAVLSALSGMSLRQLPSTLLLFSLAVAALDAARPALATFSVTS
jgi:hypothetical protein